MAETQPTSNDPGVTVAIARRVKPGCEAEFEAFLTGVTAVCSQFPGHLGSTIFRPVNSEDPEYRVVFKFDRLSNLRRWEASADRQHWFEICEPLTLSPPEIQVLTGLETWFTLPGQPTIQPPPRYKMVVVTWLAVFPLITLISMTLQTYFAPLPLILRAAIITGIAVPTMTYVVMPQMTKLMAGWLYPVADTPSRIAAESHDCNERDPGFPSLLDLQSLAHESTQPAIVTERTLNQSESNGVPRSI